MENRTSKNAEYQNIIKVAIVGSGGSGRTTFYNKATELATQLFPDRPIIWFDLKDPEEIPIKRPDVVLQIIDSTDLDESMVLTPQLIDMHIKLVLALNHYDQLLNTNHSIDYQKLAHLMGVQIFPTNAVSGEGIDTILKMVIDAYDDKENTSRHVHVEYGKDLEEAIDDITLEISKIPHITEQYSKRYISIRLLERPEVTLALLQSYTSNIMALAYAAEKNRRKLEKELFHSPAELIHEARHGFISGALNETLRHSNDHRNHTLQQRIDAILTNRWLGFPILIAALYIVFQCTFTLGAYPQQLIQDGINYLCLFFKKIMPDIWYTSLLTDGILQGIGAVLSFLPNIILLFFFISLMEDSGYMARVAFLMDKIMHKVGLHGRSFVPMLVGFGCNVPAIMAARNIDNHKDRTLTMLMIPFMSCGARLPVYMLFISAFFYNHQALVMMSLYLIGILLSILFALIMKRTKYFKKAAEDYVSELPAFRIPTLRNTAAHIWERCEDYLKKISTVILWASIVIWALSYFPRNEELYRSYDEQIYKLETLMSDIYDQPTNSNITTRSEALQHDAVIRRQIDSLQFAKDIIQKEHSALATIGNWIEPIMKPLGFDWRMNVCIITGLPAKEAIVSTMGILFHQPNETQLEESLASNPFFSPLKAYAFMLFVLLYFPCIATIATLRREIGYKWATFTVIHSLALAWFIAFLVFQLGSLFL